MADAPDFLCDSPSPQQLTELIQAYERITRDPVRSLRKRNLVASAYRVRGPALLDFIAETYARQGSANNLLGLARTTTAPLEQPGRRSPAGATSAPVRNSSTAVRGHDGLPCPVEQCLPNLIYCAEHRPAFLADPRRRYDGRPPGGGV